MRINYNISAAISNKHLLGIENNLSQSMERLSSGLKINHSKDNPAGMAISHKMQVQINGLDRASSNASDGISVIHIADGALNETTSILQRMRELSVQAANDATMSLSDKQAIQKEIDSLKEEVDRISTDTEYNTKALLDGSLDTRVYTKHADRVQISDQIEPGTYKVQVLEAATQAQVTSSANFNSTAQIGTSGTMKINGSEVAISATDSYEEVYEKIRNAGAIGETTVERAADGSLTFTADAYGAGANLAITFDNEALANKLSLSDASGNNGVVQNPDTGEWVYGRLETDATTGKTNVLVPTGTNMKLNDVADWEGFTSSATAVCDGNRVTITDIGDVSLSFLVEAGYQQDPADPTDTTGGALEFEVTELGSMTLHIGANMDQNMEIRIPEVSCKSLYIDDMDVTTVTGADRAMASLDDAIARVSEVRSRLGAYENRLEYSTESLDAFEENMTGAMSRLTDVDMAEEMTNYTHQNVLNQAAISVLTQANDLPQQVLQILQ